MDEPIISYSVRDILERMENKLDSALVAIATKAEHAELLELKDRVAILEQIEKNREKEKSWRHQWRQLIWPTLIGAGLLAVAIITLLK